MTGLKTTPWGRAFLVLTAVVWIPALVVFVVFLFLAAMLAGLFEYIVYGKPSPRDSYKEPFL